MRDDNPIALRSPFAHSAQEAVKGPWPKAVRPEEAAFAELAAAAPSSAGFYLDATGTIHVVVKDVADANAARSAVLTMVSTGRVVTGKSRAASIVTEDGRFTFGELAVIRDAIHEHLLASQRIVMLDLNEQTNRVELGIDRLNASYIRETLPADIAALGLDTNAIAYREATIPRLAIAKGSYRRRFGSTIQSTVDTITGGIQMERQGHACTIGVIALYNSAPSVLSNSHCSETLFSYDGDSIEQATTTSPGRRIGHETVDPPGTSCYGYPCRGSDAALFGLESGILYYTGMIARTASRAGPATYTLADGSKTWDASNPYFYVSNTVTPTTGMEVNKVGMRTGWTYGYVTNTCVDGFYGTSPNLMFITCSMVATVHVDGGDSGSPVFAFGGSPGSGGGMADLVDFAGLIFAGYASDTLSYFSPYGRIASDIGGSLSVTVPITLSTPSLSGSVGTGGSQVLSWGSVTGAEKYQVYGAEGEGSGSSTTYPVGTTTGTSMTITTLYATGYTGGTQPSSGTWVRYSVYALGKATRSAQSNFVYFTTGCTGRC
ncbi:MAG: hypothetical protein U9Q74_09760 [Gemmatimonadota bacterium]|nr:hypothetical protein [Gemmatimonadota bacterium]